jgi:DNA-binding Xre family transcriptional regulator
VISFKPLFKTLVDLDLSLTDLEKKCGFSSATTAKLKKGESMRLDTIERICIVLNVPIEKVVEIIAD